MVKKINSELQNETTHCVNWKKKSEISSSTKYKKIKCSHSVVPPKFRSKIYYLTMPHFRGVFMGKRAARLPP